MSVYSKTDKFLHRLYLGNYSISKAALEMEIAVYGNKADKLNVEESVFVTGLARSGTTGVMRQIFNTGLYASLQYSNMPFVLNPNLWKKESKITTHERAHKDGIIIDGNSPEEFDEYYWKSQLKDSYINEDRLELHQITGDLGEQYQKYIRLICLAKGKQRYVSKNNNNVLRLDALRSISNSKIIFLFRHPVSHASSLHKLHLRFSKEQEEDSFVLEYFNYLGHHEFGLNHKPFALTPLLKRARDEFSPNDINYWLLIWMNYYEFILDHLQENDILICFEDLMENPDRVYNELAAKLLNHPNFIKAKGFRSTTSVPENILDYLKRESEALYSKLLEYKL